MPCLAVAAVYSGEQDGSNQMYNFQILNSEIIHQLLAGQWIRGRQMKGLRSRYTSAEQLWLLKSRGARGQELSKFKEGGVEAVENILRDYKNAKIAVYGLSPLTADFLEHLNGYQVAGLLDGYQVAGLLDGYQTSGSLYGKPILPIEEAIAGGVRLIIVAARPESCKIIAKRIGALCKKNAVKLIDIHGGDLNAPKEAAYALRACLKSSNKDGDESKSKHLSRNKEFALTIFGNVPKTV